MSVVLEPGTAIEAAPSSGPPPIVNLGYWGEGAVTAREARLTFVRQLADRLSELEGRRVLEASHGTAGPAVVLALEYGASVDVLNAPPEQTEMVRSYAADHGIEDQIRFHDASSELLPFDPESFDVVFSLEAAHGLANKRRFVREAYRVLAPGGVLALSDMTATIDMPLARRVRSPGVDLVTAEAWRAMAQQAGFEILEHRLVGSAVYPGHRRWLMLTAAERRRAILATLAPAPDATRAAARRAEAWWREFRINRSAPSLTGALGLREYVLMLARRPRS